jgi:hypothetical protein
LQRCLFDIIVVIVPFILLFPRVHGRAFVISGCRYRTHAQQVAVLNLSRGLKIAVVCLLFSPLSLGGDEPKAAAAEKADAI